MALLKYLILAAITLGYSFDSLAIVTDTSNTEAKVLDLNLNDSVQTLEEELSLQKRSLMLIVLDETAEPMPSIKLLIEGHGEVESDADGIVEVEILDSKDLALKVVTSTFVLQQNKFELPKNEEFTQLTLQLRKPNEEGVDSNANLDMVVVAQREALHARKEVSKKVVARDEMQEVAASMGDPLRVIASLPGVSVNSDLNVRPYVRGGDERETRIFWNNVPLIQPYHALSAYSIFNMETIESAEFYSGGFPVEGNGSLSGALFMESRPAPTDSLDAMVHASLLRGNAYVGVPILEDKLGVYFAYQAFLYDWVIKRGMDLARFQADDEGDEAIDRYQKFIDLPNFKDLEFGINYEINPRMSLEYTMLRAQDLFRVLDPRDAITGLGEGDLTETASRIDTLALIDITNWIHGVNLNYVVNAKWIMENTVSFQSQVWNVEFDDIQDEPIYDLDRSVVSLRNHNLYQYNDKNLFSFGLSYDLKLQEYDVKLPKAAYEMLINSDPDVVNYIGHFNPEGLVITNESIYTSLSDFGDQIIMDYKGDRAQHYSAVYFSDEYTWNPKRKITLGGRLEYENRSSELFLAPRISWYESIDSKNEISTSIGLYSQNEYEFYYRHFNADLKSEKAWHLNVEWSHDITPYYSFEWSNYGKYYYDLASIRLEPSDELNTDLFWRALNLFSGLVDAGDELSQDSIAASLGISSSELDQNLENYTDTILSRMPSETEKIVRDVIAKKRLDFSNSGRGYALGSEISFKYDPSKVWRGWLSFEASMSQRQDSENGIWYNFREHRPWSIKWHNFFNMPNKYQLAIKLNVSAGQAYTGYTDFQRLLREGVQSDTLFVVEEKNNSRFSPYTRVDIRLSQESTFWGHPAVSFFEIWNAFNEPNMFLTDNESKRLKSFQFNIPFPTIFLGYEVRW